MGDKGLPPFLKAAVAGHIPSLEKSFNNDSLTLADAVSNTLFGFGFI